MTIRNMPYSNEARDRHDRIFSAHQKAGIRMSKAAYGLQESVRAFRKIGEALSRRMTDAKR